MSDSWERLLTAQEAKGNVGNLDVRVLSYAAGLEVVVERLRKQCRLLQLEAKDTVARISLACDELDAEPAIALREIKAVGSKFAEFLVDFDDADDDIGEDRVTESAFRPMVERVFRRLQRLAGMSRVQLQLEIGSEQIVWFPGRLRQILENLISNALSFHDPAKGETRIQVGLRSTESGYELRIADNGIGLSRDAQSGLFELFDRSGTPQLKCPAMGFAVLKQLIDESGGSLSVESVKGQGAAFVASLPWFSRGVHLN